MTSRKLRRDGELKEWGTQYAQMDEYVHWLKGVCDMNKFD